MHPKLLRFFWCKNYINNNLGNAQVPKTTKLLKLAHDKLPKTEHQFSIMAIKMVEIADVTQSGLLDLKTR